MRDGPHILLVEISDYLRRCPEAFIPLSRLYCTIWPEPPWNEYMICPACGRYYSQDQVCAGTTSCNGGHPREELEMAWLPHQVVENIHQDLALPGLIGAILVDPSTGPVGFSWGHLSPIQNLAQSLKHTFAKNRSGDAFYYSELAIKDDARYRGRGLGAALVRFVVERAREKFPRHFTVLRTHELSPARVLFERAGYAQIPHSDINPGRILMQAETCSALTTACL